MDIFSNKSKNNTSIFLDLTVFRGWQLVGHLGFYRLYVVENKINWQSIILFSSAFKYLNIRFVNRS